MWKKNHLTFHHQDFWRNCFFRGKTSAMYLGRSKIKSRLLFVNLNIPKIKKRDSFSCSGNSFVVVRTSGLRPNMHFIRLSNLTSHFSAFSTAFWHYYHQLVAFLLSFFIIFSRKSTGYDHFGIHPKVSVKSKCYIFKSTGTKRLVTSFLY